LGMGPIPNPQSPSPILMQTIIYLEDFRLKIYNILKIN
jgi:hypothetical protein